MEGFAAEGPDGLHFVLDFDHTLTAGKNPGENVGTWDILDEFLPPEGRERHRQIFQTFRAKELSGQLSLEETRDAWSETLDLVCSYHINLQSAEHTFLEVATLRQGVKPFLISVANKECRQ